MSTSFTAFSRACDGVPSASKLMFMEYGPDYLLYLLIRGVIVEHFQHGFKHLTVDLEKLEDYVLVGQGREEVYRDNP